MTHQARLLAYAVYNLPHLNYSGRVGEPLPRFESLGMDEVALFNEWLTKGQGIEGETDGYPFWSLFDNVRTWWEVRRQPNVLFVHFEDM